MDRKAKVVDRTFEQADKEAKLSDKTGYNYEDSSLQQVN